MRSLNRRRDRPDPAPSRLAWRLERWMLTPGFRLALRAGLPFMLTFGLASWWLSIEENRRMISDTVVEARTAIEQRPEFMVSVMAVEGAGETVAAEIRDILPIDLPASSFDIDLEHLRGLIEGLDPVQAATVRIRPGGVLEVRVTERVPVAVWRTYDAVTVIDATGTHVASVQSRLARPDLPLIAGEGADLAVAEALELHAAAAPLGARLRGFVRMGERRWDVVLDRGQRILLPEEGALQALERVIVLDKAQELLERDVAQVDMRLGQRPTLRMNPDATEAWWRIREQTEALAEGR